MEHLGEKLNETVAGEEIKPVGRSKATPMALAELLRSLLERLSLLERTSVNRRLIADAVFFDLAITRLGLFT